MAVLKFDRKIVVTGIEVYLKDIDCTVEGAVLFDTGYSSDLKYASGEVLFRSEVPFADSKDDLALAKALLLAHARREARIVILNEDLAEQLHAAHSDRREAYEHEKQKARASEEVTKASPTLLVENYQ
jgi:hypothetical protein